MTTPDDRRYTESHEWLKPDGDTYKLGLTQHAVDELTDITYVEMKSPGDSFGAGDSIGEVESVKAASDVYSPLPGEIVEVNARLADDPSLLNSDPFGEGWLVRIRASDASGFDALLDAAAYASRQG
ncbi:MAG: glycine cleavage system protein GcvH [Phycisphaeraceae bacterium]|nr:glycine cleavage system protein GcvH [Phycisphaeraceae bacterium]MCB9847408.1 glycine cleavage system protein GcvH [Phycisphaeraceae bacterium]